MLNYFGMKNLLVIFEVPFVVVGVARVTVIHDWFFMELDIAENINKW